MKVCYGSTRTVILLFGLAIKVAGHWQWKHRSFWWKNFLLGLLGNMQEKSYSDAFKREQPLCPVIFYVKGGFVLFMPRVRALSPDVSNSFDYVEFCGREKVGVPFEFKPCSLGYLKDRLVIVDYGN